MKQEIIYTGKQKYFGGKTYKIFTFLFIILLFLFPFFVFYLFRLEWIKYYTNSDNFININTLDNFSVFIFLPLALILTLWVLLERPISLSAGGIYIPKFLILRRFIPKQNISAIYIGKYSDIDRGKSKTIFALLNAFSTISRYSGQNRVSSKLNTFQDLKETLVMRIDTIDNTFLTYLSDFDELIKNLKKIGINFSQENGVFCYGSGIAQIHKKKFLKKYFLPLLVSIYVLLGITIVISLYFTLKK